MATIVVSNAAQLLTALQSASSGDTISLQTGNYGDLNLSNMQFSGEVTITSEDPASAAVFSGLKLTNVANLTFDSVVFDYQATSNPWQSERPFEVSQSADISIVNSVFDGDLAQSSNSAVDGYGTGIGLYVNFSQNVTVENNEFYDWYRGAFYNNVDTLTVTGNEVYDIRSDGMNFANTDNVLIEGNYFHDFRTAPNTGDHPDMIQFWTTGTTSPSENILIRANVFDIGQGSWTETIFMGNTLAGSDPSMYYRNVTIEDNLVHNGHLHGIQVDFVDGLTIQNNTLVPSTDTADRVQLPGIRTIAASNVTITNNTAFYISPAEPGWTYSGNTLIQSADPTQANYSGNIDIHSLMAAILNGTGSTTTGGSTTPGGGTTTPGGGGTTPGGTGDPTGETGTGGSDPGQGGETGSGGSDPGQGGESGETGSGETTTGTATPLGSGAQVISGSLSALDATVYSGFGTDDSISLTGSTVARNQVAISPGSAIIDIDLDRDGVSDGTIKLEGDFSGGDFMVAVSGGNTILTYSDYLNLREGQRLADAKVNGVVNQAYLNGDTANSFEVTIQTGSGANNRNTVGVYEIDGNGNIVDVRFLTDDAKRDAGSSYTVNNVEDGNDLGFFLVQDGGRTLDDSVLASGNLSFVRLSDGTMALAENGVIVGGARTFLSSDPGFNFDGAEHVTSGVAADGSGALMVGFEDMDYLSANTPDADFEDVLLHVEALYDFA